MSEDICVHADKELIYYSKLDIENLANYMWRRTYGTSCKSLRNKSVTFLISNPYYLIFLVQYSYYMKCIYENYEKTLNTRGILINVV